jgi:hypothetical protein
VIACHVARMWSSSGQQTADVSSGACRAVTCAPAVIKEVTCSNGGYDFCLAEIILHIRSVSAVVLVNYALRACIKRGKDEKCVENFNRITERKRYVRWETQT